MAYIVVVCRFVIGGVFLYSALSKVRSRRSFGSFVLAVRLLTNASRARAVSVAVVGVEFGLAGSLLIGLEPRAFLAAAAAVLAVFTGVLVSGLRRGITASCMCLGQPEEPIAWRHVGRNLALIAVAVMGAVVAAAYGSGPTTPIGVALCLVGAFVVVVVIAYLDDLLAVLGSPARRS